MSTSWNQLLNYSYTFSTRRCDYLKLRAPFNTSVFAFLPPRNVNHVCGRVHGCTKGTRICVRVVCVYVFLYKFINYTSYTVMQRNTGVLSLEEFSVTINCEIPTIHRRKNEEAEARERILSFTKHSNLWNFHRGKIIPFRSSDFKPILSFFFFLLWMTKKLKIKRRISSIHGDLGHSSFDMLVRLCISRRGRKKRRRDRV